MQHYRSVWISDIHLGTRGCKADHLCNFLKSTRCDNLFLIGDIVDGWRLSKQWYWPQEHSNVVRRILTKAKRGTKVIYITGNHDEFLRSWFNSSIDVGNIHIANEYSYLDVKGRNWLIVHGDLFDQVTRHWRWLSILGDNAYNFLLYINRWTSILRARLGLGYWSLSSFLKNKTKQAVNFIYRFEEHLTIHAQQQGYQGVICGHIHTPTIKTIQSTIYINDGDWVESCSALVEDFNGDFILLSLDINGEMSEIARL